MLYDGPSDMEPGDRRGDGDEDHRAQDVGGRADAARIVVTSPPRLARVSQAAASSAVRDHPRHAVEDERHAGEPRGAQAAR